MCRKDHYNVRVLIESLKKVRPFNEATDEEKAWYRGTMHGVILALKQIEEVDDDEKRQAA